MACVSACLVLVAAVCCLDAVYSSDKPQGPPYEQLQHFARRPFISGSLSVPPILTVQALTAGTPPVLLSSLFRRTAPVPRLPGHPPFGLSTCLSTPHRVTLPSLHEANSLPRGLATWGDSPSHHGPGPFAQPVHCDSAAPTIRSSQSKELFRAFCGLVCKVGGCCLRGAASAPLPRRARGLAPLPGASAPGGRGQPPSEYSNLDMFPPTINCFDDFGQEDRTSNNALWGSQGT